VDQVALLRLISESTRHGLLAAMRGGEKTVGELVEAVKGEQSNVSHHLAVLRKAGLVAVRRDGRQQRYRLADAEVGRLLDQVRHVAVQLEQVAYTASLGLPVDPSFHGYG
jgi:DNA-binding transcriptional ArsR family regulator